MKIKKKAKLMIILKMKHCNKWFSRTNRINNYYKNNYKIMEMILYQKLQMIIDNRVLIIRDHLIIGKAGRDQGHQGNLENDLSSSKTTMSLLLWNQNKNRSIYKIFLIINQIWNQYEIK